MMDKSNVFCSSPFYMGVGDILHILIIDEVGTPIDVELSTGDDNYPPSAPIATDATSVTASSFVANWLFNENSTGYYIDVATDIGFTSLVVGYDNLDAGNNISHIISGLSGTTTYYYRVRAYNEYGTSLNSNIITTSTEVTGILGALYNWYAITKASTVNAYSDVYGALYNWHAVTYSTGGASIAPVGWHVPTLTEWTALITEVGGSGVAGAALKEAGTSHWDAPNTGATNSSGFTALPGGYRRGIPISFSNLYLYSVFWTATEYDVTYAYYVNLFYNNDNITISWDNKPAGRSLRLIKDDSIDPGTMEDIDGNVYNTVTIGTQVWMAENLKVTHYNNGTAIPNVTLKATWDALTTGALCYYANEVTTSTSIFAPTGWHIPTLAEWQSLSIFLGGDTIAGGKLKQIGLTHWNDPNTGASDDYGFTSLPAGLRHGISGEYQSVGDVANYACVDEAIDESNTVPLVVLAYDSADFSAATNNANKSQGASIRCLLDGVNPADPGTVTDIDGNVYPTVKIGTQVWMAENFKVTRYNNGTPIHYIVDNMEWVGDILGGYSWYNNIIP